MKGRPGGWEDELLVAYLLPTGHVAAYKDWLRAGGLEHSPGRFRRWLLEEYRPRGPSREDWEFNPYPLIVVTRPPADPATAAVAAGGRARDAR